MKAPWPTPTQDTIDKQNAEGPRIRVRVIDPRGVYYEHLRRREGDVFDLNPKMITETDKNTGGPAFDEKGKPRMKLVTAQEQFSPKTMEIVDMDEPEVVTTSKDAMQKAQNELDQEKVPAKRH